MRYLRRIRVLLITLAIIAAGSSHAQVPAKLRIATRIIPPFVMQDKGGALTGFSIELWNSIAADLHTSSSFIQKGSVADLLQAVQSKEADVGIAAVSITSERDKVLDFSQPMFNSGLQILTASKPGSTTTSPIRGFLGLLFSPVMLVWLGIALVLVVVPAHIAWFLERNHENGIVPTKSYFPGIFHATWWAASTLATQADSMPRTALARVLAVIWMFTSVVFVAYFTAQVTATLTVQQLHGNIKGPDDLPGKRVATTKGSTAAAYLKEAGSEVIESEKIDDAFSALQSGTVEAVVFDAPVLLYYAAHDGKGKSQVIGSVFKREDYGIVFPPDSPLRKPVNLALLRLRESGSYQKIYDKWFASE